MISVIIPHHNDLINLTKLINSIPKDNKYEVIVIDDHSEIDFDKLNEEVKKINPDAKVFKNNSNINSAGKARNIGIEKSSGKWLLFADSDDIFLPKLDEVISEYENSEADIIYFNPTTFTADNLANNTRSNYKDKYSDLINEYFTSDSKDISKWKIRLTFDVPWSKLIKKSTIIEKNIKFDEVIRHNDTVFSQKIGIFSDNIKIDNRTIYCVSKNLNSLSNKITKEHFYSMVEVNIRSIKLKKKYVDSQLLDSVNPSLDCQPMMLVLRSIKHVSSPLFTLSLLKLYMKNNITVFSLNNIKKFLKEEK